MSDLDQLRVNLDEALRAITLGPAPVDRVVRRGRGIRARRRLAAVAGIGALAVAGVAGYPALTHKQAAPAHGPATNRPAVTHNSGSVTDVPPGPDARPGLIAEGEIFGEPWHVRTGKPGTNGLPSAAPGQQCFAASGSAIGTNNEPLTWCQQIPAPNAATPVAFTGFAAGGLTEISLGQAAADVQYVTVRLSDGTRFKLIPVDVNGIRYVAFAVPETLSVDSANAYLDNGQYLTAVPFDVQRNLVIFGMWQRPGQHVPARVTKTIATGPGGKAWWATAYAGPWGTCLTDTFNENVMCVPSAAPLDTRVLLVASSSPYSVFGSAANAVSYLRVTLTHGAPLRVSPVTVGDQKFFAFLLGDGQSIRHWTAYNAAGIAIASGSGK